MSRHIGIFSILCHLAACGQDALNSSFKTAGDPAHDFMTLVARGIGPNYFAAIPASSKAAFTSSSESTGKVVVLERDPQSDMIAFVSYDTAQMPTVALADLDRAARSYIKDNESELGIQSHELEAMADPVSVVGNIAAITFHRSHQGLPVKGAFIQIIFMKNASGYHLAQVQNRMFGELNLARSPAIFTDADIAAKTGITGIRVLDSSEIIAPKAMDHNGIEFVVAQNYSLENTVNGEMFHVIVDSNSGDMLEAWSRRAKAEHRFSLKSLARTYLHPDKLVTEPMSAARFNGVESNQAGVIQGFSGRTAKVSLEGAYAQIIDGGSVVTFLAPTGVDSTVIAQSSKVSLEAINAQAAIARVTNFVAKYLDLSRLEPVKVHINSYQTDASGRQEFCNAFYENEADGPSLHFYPEGDGCGNTSLVNDIIYHEWGHRLDDAIGSRPGLSDGAFSEGVGDILASYLNNDSNISPGFRLGDERALRQVKNLVKYSTVKQEVHEEGLIIGGAFWDMRELLILRFGANDGAEKASQIFFKHLKVTDSYLESYRNVLAIDDDDANPSTQSPNHCLITEAFANHGLAKKSSSCVDKPLVSVDPTLSLALKIAIGEDDSNGNPFIWGAQQGLDSFGLCVGELKACVSSKTLALNFSLDRMEADLAIYRSHNGFPLKDGGIVTLMSFDASGNVKAARSVRFRRQATSSTP